LIRGSYEREQRRSAARQIRGWDRLPAVSQGDPKETPRQTAQSIGALSTVGLSFVLAIVLGAWFGYLLDKWLGTSPWLFLLFFILGFVAGVLNVYRTANRFIK